MGSFAVGKEPSEASAETFVKQMRVQNSADFAQAKPSERVQSEIKSNSSEARMSVAKQRPRAKRVGETVCECKRESMMPESVCFDEFIKTKKRNKRSALAIKDKLAAERNASSRFLRKKA